MRFSPSGTLLIYYTIYKSSSGNRKKCILPPVGIRHIRLDGRRSNGAFMLRVSPASTFLLVSIGDIGEELAQFHGTTTGMLLLAQEPEEFVDDRVASIQCEGRMLVDFAREEPALGLLLQFRQGQSGGRFLQTRR